MDGNEKLMRASVEWMSAKYDEMNALLFGGKLGACNFEVFTSGSGSRGKTLGHFCLKGKNLHYFGQSRKLVKRKGYNITQIDASNFAELCEPSIGLNGNYSATEFSLTATLVHEMCHYWTYRNGIIPSRPHGAEFKSIASAVSSRAQSNGMNLNIKRLASAEECAGYVLDADIAAKNKQQTDKKKSRLSALFIIFYDLRGAATEARLVTTSHAQLVDEIVASLRGNYQAHSYAYVTNNPNVINSLWDIGYRHDMRTYRFWRVDVRLAQRYGRLSDSKCVYMDEYLERFGRDNLFEGKYMEKKTLFQEIVEKTLVGDDLHEFPSGLNLGIESPLDVDFE